MFLYKQTVRKHYLSSVCKWITALSYNCSISVILTKWFGMEGCSMQTRTTGNDEKQPLIAFFKSSSVWPENNRWWNSLWWNLLNRPYFWYSTVKANGRARGKTEWFSNNDRSRDWLRLLIFIWQSKSYCRKCVFIRLLDSGWSDIEWFI